ncbi:MAG: hypothetical protein WA049_18525 [Ferribacterium limneticum]
MSFWNNLFSWNHESGLGDSLSTDEPMKTIEINPATGLPMIGDDCGGIDVAGNPYGIDLDSSNDADIFTTMGQDEQIFGDDGF